MYHVHRLLVYDHRCTDSLNAECLQWLITRKSKKGWRNAAHNVCMSSEQFMIKDNENLSTLAFCTRRSRTDAINRRPQRISSTNASSWLRSLTQQHTQKLIKICPKILRLQHHEPSILQHKNFSRCHSYLLTSPGDFALLQHGIQFLLPLKIVPPYTVSSATSSLTS